ncbi:MAG TPA: PP2C family protein-serine/threonine phosphatase [Mycobacteriales bacterium]
MATGVGSRRRSLPVLPALRTALVRRGVTAERGTFIGLVAFAVAVWAGTAFGSPPVLPIAAQTVPIVLGNLVLGVRTLQRLLVAVGALVLAAFLELGPDWTRLGSVLVVVLTGAVVYRTALVRERRGLRGISGDALLADLRDRLSFQAALPALPPGWRSDVATRLAGGLAFGGDFLVAGGSGARVELALVDVSGKGVAAATRALQLSGALGGLMSSVDHGGFLAAANRYVLRQGWVDGFATAVHVSIDTCTGAYVVDSAGHPPAAAFVGDTGEWTLHEETGPALGLIEDVAYPPQRGTLRPGDALLLYTDGVVEVAGQDLDRGIDRLLGEATRLVVDQFAGGGARLLETMPDASGDDRAVVLIWRT